MKQARLHASVTGIVDAGLARRSLLTIGEIYAY
jgi:hypothetical protein